MVQNRERGRERDRQTDRDRERESQLDREKKCLQRQRITKRGILEKERDGGTYRATHLSAILTKIAEILTDRETYNVRQKREA